MCDSRQPLNGADSFPSTTANDPTPEELDPNGYFLCRVGGCGLRAVLHGECAGHGRLGDYTSHERSGGIAANE